jgi:hypothetical protein
MILSELMHLVNHACTLLSISKCGDLFVVLCMYLDDVFHSFLVNQQCFKHVNPYFCIIISQILHWEGPI